MAKVYTYPHWEISVVDKSIYTPIDNEILPLFRPMFFMRTQQGPAGVPVWRFSMLPSETWLRSVRGKINLPPHMVRCFYTPR